MPVYLLDANVLLALLWPNHTHHGKVHPWFTTHATEGWATCPMTQCAFVRLSSNPKYTTDPLNVREAVTFLEKSITHPQHVFWEDDIQLSNQQFISRRRLQGHKQITDAYLLGLAIRRGGMLATLDEGIPTLTENNSAVVLIPHN